jgi:hypothetical protein
MIELHMNFVPVDFVFMDIRSNTSILIILGRPLFRTTSVVIDSEGNVKFQFPHKKCMENFPRNKINFKKYKFPHETFPSLNNKV